MPHPTFRVLALGAAAVMGLSTDALAAGRFNVPSTLGQYVGYGFGPGYHASIALGPGRTDPKPRVHRMLHAPRLPAGCRSGFCAPSTLAPAHGWGPATLAPQPTPAPQPTRFRPAPRVQAGSSTKPAATNGRAATKKPAASKKPAATGQPARREPASPSDRAKRAPKPEPIALPKA